MERAALRPGSPLEVFDRFRRTLWFRVLFILLLGLIIGLVIPIAAAGLGCFLAMAFGIAMFAGPYMLGERKVSRMFVQALLIALIASLVAAALIGSNLGTIEEQTSSGSMNGFTLSDGRASPYEAPGLSQVNFSVDVRSDNESLLVRDVAVFVALTHSEVLGESTRWVDLLTSEDPASNLTEPVSYARSISLPSWAIHQHRFEVFSNEVVVPIEDCPYNITARTWTEFWEIRPCTGGDPRMVFYAGAPRAAEAPGGRQFGPITATGFDLFAFAMGRELLFMIVPLMTFLIIAMMFWWTRRAREIRSEQDSMAKERIAAAGGEFTCSNCGTDIPGAASKCPKCGAIFEEPQPEKGVAPEKAAPTPEATAEVVPSEEAKKR